MDNIRVYDIDFNKKEMHEIDEKEMFKYFKVSKKQLIEFINEDLTKENSKFTCILNTNPGWAFVVKDNKKIIKGYFVTFYDNEDLPAINRAKIYIEYIKENEYYISEEEINEK